MRTSNIYLFRLARHAKAERNFLEGLNHPHITDLKFSFQDNQFVYIVTDLYEAGDLRLHMGNKRWTEDECRPIMAHMISAIAYLNSFDIVHRDIKPDVIAFHLEHSTR